MLHQSIRVRDLAQRPEVEGGHRRRDDARARRDAEGRGVGGGGDAKRRRRRRRRPSPKSSRRARRREGRGRRRSRGGPAVIVMKLIVGLGNPGREYRDTRHNVGFMVVDEIARRHSLTWAMAPSQVPDAFVAKRFGAEPVLLAKPLTYMNRSGDAVAALARYYDVAPARPADRRRRSGPAVRQAAGAGARIGGRRTTVSSRSSSGLGPRSFPGCGWGWGAATRGGISPITCSRNSSAANAPSSNRSSPGRPTPPRCSPRRASSR